jgi:DNA-binding NtrC family response regulator
VTTTRATILVVHPASDVCLRLRAGLRAHHDVLMARSLSEAKDQARTPVTAALVAFDLPDAPAGQGVAATAALLAGAPTIALAPAADRASADAARRQGAAGCVAVDADRAALLTEIERATTRGPAPADPPRNQRRDKYEFSQLTSQSPSMLRVFDQIRAVAPTDATVLVLGETGTGKELVSRAIHHRSRRQARPLISVNCGAFAESLLESELFGHEKGAFTGASERRQGVFEMADGGTLFLDELGETSLGVQVNLLRVLETMRFRRVGGRDEVQVDVRIVAATHVALERAVRDKRFREDLYYRLNVFPIPLPPLRERREDIPLLMRNFLEETAQDYGLEPPHVSPEALERALAYPWPGNVRQLRTLCERWVITRHGQRLEVGDLPSEMAGPAPARVGDAPKVLDLSRSLADNVGPALSAIERDYLAALLDRHGYRMDRTAAAAGISRRTLFNKIKEYGLPSRKPTPER